MMPLTMAVEGDTVVINFLDIGEHLRRRLIDLGMHDRATITVIKNDVFGSMIVSVKDSRLVIGRGQASKIMVTSV
ncbi:MAG: FeoA family protein [archaeon]